MVEYLLFTKELLLTIHSAPLIIHTPLQREKAKDEKVPSVKFNSFQRPLAIWKGKDIMSTTFS